MPSPASVGTIDDVASGLALGVLPAGVLAPVDALEPAPGSLPVLPASGVEEPPEPLGVSSKAPLSPM